MYEWRLQGAPKELHRGGLEQCRHTAKDGHYAACGGAEEEGASPVHV